MLGKISKARHATVLAAIGGTTLLGATGVIGGGAHPERYDAWQSVVTPAGGDAVRIVDTFDQDFGSNDRRGHERYIDNDAGVPIDVVASSPDAPDDVSVVDLGLQTRVRVGDPDVTITGQHRYLIGYTLPSLLAGSDVLSLDVLSGDGPEIDRFELIVTGFVLDDPVCLFGPVGAETECDWTDERDGYYRAVIEPLGADEGVTVEGDVVGVVTPVEVDPPALPERRGDPNPGLVAVGLAGLGAAGAAPVYRWARRKGRNEVYAGGAADAAFGAMSPPRPDGTTEPPPPVHLVPDDELGDLATIEFVPPKGLAPWEGHALLNERLGDGSVEAWFSGLAGQEAIVLAEVGSNLSIASGPKRGSLAAADAALLDRFLSSKDPYVTGKYDPRFATAWKQVLHMQSERIGRSGWWKHGAPGRGFSVGGSGVNVAAFLPVIAFGLVWFGALGSAVVGLLQGWIATILVAALFPAVVAYFVYRALLPARSAPGSALALRTESFRRFLHASEGRHVEWAWSQGLLREYSAWAVALGEADAWSKALAGANVPAPARAAAGPVIIASRGSSMRSTRTAPSSSGGGGGGGGARSGRVGGGGGGSSRGSW